MPKHTPVSNTTELTPQTKVCSKCLKYLDYSMFYVVYGKALARCKTCYNQDCKSYKERNRDKRKIYQDKYNLENKEKQRIHKRAYQQKCKDILRAKGRKRYAENRERLLALTKNKYKSYIENLSEPYLIHLLKHKGFTKEEIKSNSDLLDIQKLLTLNKRAIKNLQ